MSFSLKRKSRKNITLKKYKIDKNDNVNKIIIKHKEIKPSMPSFKTQIVDFVSQLIKIKQAKGEFYKAKLLEKAQSNLLNTQFKNFTEMESIKGVGPMTLRKCKEFMKKGTTSEIEDYKTNPLYVFLKIHGVGIRKAQELVNAGIKSIEELRQREDLLNDVQKKGLKYFEDVNQRIPRDEIELYKGVFDEIFNSIKNDDSSYEIVGSYRRIAETSGDIDLIITDPDDTTILHKFLVELVKKNILVEILSRGNIKCLAIGKIGSKPARRIDFMYSPPDEYAFAILYFTGSRLFNTLMRNRALKMGYSLNEHGLYKMVDGKKTHKISGSFPTEKSIFDFLKMAYKHPHERVDYDSVVAKKNKSLKNRKKSSVLKNIKLFVRGGLAVLQVLSEKDIAKMVKTTDNYYYKHNTPLLTDDQYDILKSFAQEKFPNNDVINNGHLNIEMSKEKVDLPYFMGSMEKIKPDTRALANWRKSYKGPYVVSSKLDGISALYTTENGVKRLYTRGNGRKGLNISYLIPHLQLPDVENITIRGELLLRKDVFKEKYAGIYKNVRNMIGGIMTTKRVEQEKWDSIDFVGYEVIKPVLKPSDQMLWLQENNVITVTNSMTKFITNDGLSKMLLETRENDPYDIDGIIVVDDKIYERTDRKCPKHAFAFKMVLSDQVMESQVVDVIWQISKNGYIIPKVQVVPVEIGGTTITYATGHNAGFIEKNKIGIGAVIQMIRSGDVIPKIKGVVKPADEPLMPNVEYIWNESHVDIILKDIQTNEMVQIKKILAFMQTLDVPSFGEGNVKKVFKAGFNTIPKILSMSPDDFMTIPGFKSKLSNKICGGIRERLEKTSLADLMVATNIFGRGMGKSRAKLILKHFPDILTSNKSEEEKLTMVESLSGFARKTAEIFVPYIPNFIDFIEKTNLQHKLEVCVPEVNTDHQLYQKKIVMTGFRDKGLEKALIELGAEVSGSVSKNTFMLLVDSLSSDSGKAEKARKLGIKMMTPYAFQANYLQ